MGGVKEAFRKTFGFGLDLFAQGLIPDSLRSAGGATRTYTPKYNPETAGNQGVTFDFKNAPPWLDIKDDEGEQLNAGYSGGVN
jgi:hypothetical protein